jgi:hypothetical protein
LTFWGAIEMLLLPMLYYPHLRWRDSQGQAVFHDCGLGWHRLAWPSTLSALTMLIRAFSHTTEQHLKDLGVSHGQRSRRAEIVD